MAIVAQVVNRDQWRATLADAWARHNFLLVVLPVDENREQEARAVRECLVAPDGLSMRASAPARASTFCCSAPIDGRSLRVAVAEAGDCREQVEAARCGEPRDAFYGAIWGVQFAGVPRLTDWLRAEYAEMCADNQRNPRHLHLLTFITCSPQAVRGIPLPEGTQVETMPPASTGELLIHAESVATDLWPDADSHDLPFLRSALLDMASGRIADLDAAVGMLTDRALTLTDIRNGAPVRWETDDSPVVDAARLLRTAGITPGVLSTLAMPQPDPARVGDLWAAGLWRLPEENWFSGLTSRAWTALAVSSPIVVEHAIMDVIARCLPVERLCRRILIDWAADIRRDAVSDALWGALPDGGCMADRILRRLGTVSVGGRATPYSELLGAATFGELVAILRYADRGRIYASLKEVLNRVVKARNDAAHGDAPSLIKYRQTVLDANEAMRLLPALRAL